MLKAKLKSFFEKYRDPINYFLDEEVKSFASKIDKGDTKILDAGAGECKYKYLFPQSQYVAVDLCVGDDKWNYSDIDVVADLKDIPFEENYFDNLMCNVVLEHVDEPKEVCAEFYRVLKKNGTCLIIIPFFSPEHQAPFDFYRYTSYGIKHILQDVGFSEIDVYQWGNGKILAASLLPVCLTMRKIFLISWVFNKFVTAVSFFLKYYYTKNFKPDESNKMPFGWFVYAKK